MTPDPDRIKAFASPAAFGKWLKKNHAAEPELWLRIYKKGSGHPTVTWAQAVREAIAWGWIDSLKKSFDEESYLQRFTPRRPGSAWSKINVAHVEALTKEGRMMPSGQAHVDAARADGRWDAAYAGQATFEVPEDFLEALKKASAKARRTYDGLDRANQYAIYHRLLSAKRPETRKKRIADFVAMLARGDKLH